MKIGYARISTQDQNFDLQIDALKNEGCEKIIRDTMSGAKEDRDGLMELFKIIRKGDTLVVWRLDRLGRSLKHLIEVVKELDDRNCYFKSIMENIDTTSQRKTGRARTLSWGVSAWVNKLFSVELLEFEEL